MAIKVLIVRDYNELSKRVAKIIVSTIRGKPNSVLGVDHRVDTPVGCFIGGMITVSPGVFLATI